ncbi:hypothetical protein RH915_03630 [Serpentinicella sp. ANB-PHB4]|uniref:hypothetical protein n=1 Tax=Serpentinicella sp. ANB-PHB4 TaxID=3074076 RepID=UPI002862F4E9|nr:hypothetical protein [Serpentinicella sp. ANB-PHB4]MDR5658574.1 hypothetical protein [Serpentinicella sp. ANB-PHB4]
MGAEKKVNQKKLLALSRKVLKKKNKRTFESFFAHFENGYCKIDIYNKTIDKKIYITEALVIFYFEFSLELHLKGTNEFDILPLKYKNIDNIMIKDEDNTIEIHLNTDEIWHMTY